MSARLANLPQCQPKDSPRYLDWRARWQRGQDERIEHEYEPRPCRNGRCGHASFVPRVGNQVQCDGCIALDKAERNARAARHRGAIV